MKKQIRKRRYRINKVKFIQFVIINLIFLVVLTWLCLSIFNVICNLFSDKTINNVNETSNKKIDIDVVDSIVYASDSITYEIEEENIIDYSKKPDGLKDEYYECIVETSENENVPLEVILAIITTENVTYNSNATCENENGTVDMGLCQINSKYVDYFATTYNIENLNPYNVEQSVVFVARHMKYLSEYGIEHYDLSEKDSYIFAAGAYNRGLGNECKYRNMYEYKEKFLINYEKFI